MSCGGLRAQAERIGGGASGSRCSCNGLRSSSRCSCCTRLHTAFSPINLTVASHTLPLPLLPQVG